MDNINTIVIAIGGRGERISKDLKKKGFDPSKILFRVHNKPILGHLIDMALEAKFQRIFLLISYHESDFRIYLDKNYSNESKIIPIFGGKKGKKWGVPYLLYSIRHRLLEPFIYSDGNILYKTKILQKLKNINSLGSSVVNVVVSHKDRAPTHLRITKYRGQIHNINTRLPLTKNKQNKPLLNNQYYSLGLMAWSPVVFEFVAQFAYKKDLDQVVADIFYLNRNLVQGTVYRGEWLALHTIQDIDSLSTPR